MKLMELVKLVTSDVPLVMKPHKIVPNVLLEEKESQHVTVHQDNTKPKHQNVLIVIGLVQLVKEVLTYVTLAEVTES